MSVDKQRRRLSWLALAGSVLCGGLLLWQYQEMSHRDLLAERILRGTPIAMIVCNEDGEILLFNERAQELTGYTEEELQSGGMHQLVREEDWESHKQALREAFWRLHATESGFTPPRRMTVDMLCKDGSTKKIRLSVRGAYSGDDTRFIATLQEADTVWPRGEFEEAK